MYFFSCFSCVFKGDFIIMKKRCGKTQMLFCHTLFLQFFNCLRDSFSVTILEFLAWAAGTRVVATGHLVLDDGRAIDLLCLTACVGVGGSLLIRIDEFVAALLVVALRTLFGSRLAHLLQAAPSGSPSITLSFSLSTRADVRTAVQPCSSSSSNVLKLE